MQQLVTSPIWLHLRAVSTWAITKAQCVFPLLSYLTDMGLFWGQEDVCLQDGGRKSSGKQVVKILLALEKDFENQPRNILIVENITVRQSMSLSSGTITNYSGISTVCFEKVYVSNKISKLPVFCCVRSVKRKLL